MKIYYAAIYIYIYIYMLNYTLYSLDVIWYNRFLWKSVLVSEVHGHHRGHRLLLALHMRVILLTYTFCPTLPYCSCLLTGTLCSGFASMMHLYCYEYLEYRFVIDLCHHSYQHVLRLVDLILCNCGETLSKALGHAAQGSWLGALPKPPKPQTLHTIQKEKASRPIEKRKIIEKPKEINLLLCFFREIWRKNS